MYIGRFVILGRNRQGAWYLGYRVSSRSFPNRLIRYAGDRAMVVPTADAVQSDNPYISYNCLRHHGDTVVVGNGSQVDPIIDKVKLGYPLRDAVALAMLALDYEHDAYNTPRVTAGVDGAGDGHGLLSIVTETKLLVRRLSVAPGEAFLVATYELTDPTPIELAGETAAELCDSIFGCAYELPVAALVAMPGAEGLDVATRAARE